MQGQHVLYSACAWAGDMPHVETCEMVAKSAKGSPSLPTNNFHSSSKRLASQPSSVNVSVACERLGSWTSAVWCNGQK